MLTVRCAVHYGMVDGKCLHRHQHAHSQRHQNRNLESDEVSHEVSLPHLTGISLPRCRYSKPCCQGDQLHTAHCHYFGYRAQVTPPWLLEVTFAGRDLVPRDPAAVYGPIQQIFREGLTGLPAVTWQGFDEAPAVVVVEYDKKEHQKAQSRRAGRIIVNAIMFRLSANQVSQGLLHDLPAHF